MVGGMGIEWSQFLVYQTYQKAMVRLQIVEMLSPCCNLDVVMLHIQYVLHKAKFQRCNEGTVTLHKRCLKQMDCVMPHEIFHNADYSLRKRCSRLPAREDEVLFA